MSAKQQGHTITLTTPEDLLERFNRSRQFDAWTQECSEGEIPNLEERLLMDLESHCSMVEDEMILDGEGCPVGSRLEWEKVAREP